jgi:hypothetical protein
VSLNQRLCPEHGLARDPGCFGCRVVIRGEQRRAAEFRDKVEDQAILRAAVEVRAKELEGKSVAELARMAEG